MFISGGSAVRAAPVQTLRFLHQTAHLIGVAARPGSAAEQYELPLRAAAGI
jgi:hypothetical protein